MKKIFLFSSHKHLLKKKELHMRPGTAHPRAENNANTQKKKWKTTRKKAKNIKQRTTEE